MALSNTQVQSLRTLADQYGLPHAFVLGIVDKESAGSVFWLVGGKQVPAIRIEGHYFYRLLKGAERQLAVKRGLAAPKAGAVKNPNKSDDRYRMFMRMAQINPEIAAQSISMGIGQVMGEHAVRLGYKDARDMYAKCCESFAAQVEIMLRFIKADKKLVTYAKARNYAGFARRYNGPKYKQNRYDTELKKFVERWDGKLGLSRAADTSGEAGRIAALGFGSVEEFQSHHGLDDDGIIGPLTREALVEAETAGKKALARPAQTSAILAGAGAAGTVANEALSQLSGAVEQAQAQAGALREQFDTFAPMLATARSVMQAMPSVLFTVTATVCVAAACYAVYSWYKTKDA